MQARAPRERELREYGGALHSGANVCAALRPVSLQLAVRILRFSLSLVLASCPLACTPFVADAAVARDDASAAPAPAAITPDAADDASIVSAPAVEADARSANASCDPRTPFGPPTLVAGLADLGATWIGGLRLSPDSRVGYFSANLEAGPLDNSNDSNLYTSTRVNAAYPFGSVEPVPGAGINSGPAHEVSPTVSGDGLLLVFARYPPGPIDAAVMHYATRRGTMDPFTYGGPVFSSGWDPFLREDGEVLYFAAQSDGGADSDLYRATRSGPSFDEAVAVAELNSGVDDADPVVTPDDLTIYFASKRPSTGTAPDASTSGHFSIWTATRASPSDAFSTPRPVNELDSPGDNDPSFVTADGCTLYFTNSPPLNAADVLYVARKASP